MYAVPEFGRYVSPRSTRARLPCCRVDKQAVVFRRSPAFPCLSGQQVFYPFPRLAAYIVPMNPFVSCPYFPLFLLFNSRYLKKALTKTPNRPLQNLAACAEAHMDSAYENPKHQRIFSPTKLLGSVDWIGEKR
nr:hypothetical protein [Treponema endosymbiont of Eucomonympha sp.]